MKTNLKILAGFALVAVLIGTGQVRATEAGSGLVGQVREAELAFAAALERRDREAFAGFIADDAVFFGGQVAHRGPAEILEAWSAYFKAEGPRLSWEPARIEVNEERGLATSTGPYRLTLPATAEREQQVLGGTFFSVWSRNESGEWLVIFDGGTSPQPLASAGAKASSESQ